MREKGSSKIDPRRGPLMVSILCCIALVLIAGAPLPTSASPRTGDAAVVLAAAPDWMSDDIASRLALDFDVLVPAWLPDPFTGSPSVSTASGYYELYWVITGGPPTFLYITGSVGGDIPDFSWYDRNNQLTVNAEVGGVPAYRDLTPIYDNVYWEINNVVYTVSAQGLTETDSLALANSLVRLEQPPPPPPELEQEPAVLNTAEMVSSGSLLDVSVVNGNGATLNASRGTFVDTGNASYPNLDDATVTWRAPEVASEEPVTFSLTNDSSGNWLAGATTVVIPVAAPGPVFSLSCPSIITSGEQVVIGAAGSGVVVLDASRGIWPAFGSNTDFAAAGGGHQISGTIGGGGSVEVLWQAPETAEALTASITMSGMSGATVADCSITVEPSTLPYPTGSASQSPASAPVPSSATQTVTGEPLGSDAASSGASRPTATPSSFSEGVTGRRQSTRNRPRRATSDPPPISRSTGSLRVVDNDGTGGARHPDYVGAPPGIGGDAPAIAPTSAPLPAAPRPVDSAGANADQQRLREDATTSSLETPVATEYASVAPASVEAIIGPEGGALSHPGGARLVVPAGVFSGPFRVSLAAVPNRSLRDSDNVRLIPGTGYDIEVRDANGQAITHLVRPVTLQLALPRDIDPEKTAIYSVGPATITEVETVSNQTTPIQGSLTHFSRFAAGTAAAPAGLPVWMFPWMAIGTTAMVLLAASAVAGSLQRRRASSGRKPDRRAISR